MKKIKREQRHLLKQLLLFYSSKNLRIAIYYNKKM